jgi:peptidoglycan/xylan/chitin deacetylase (PgdA/CDA1 family)
VAEPILLQHHMVGEAFVITGFLADDPGARHVDDGPHGKHPYLLWTELQDMASSGAWVVESHSVSHQDMAQQVGDRQRLELHQSRAELRARLGAPVDFFAYPFGAFNGQSRDLAQAEGYRAALAVQKGLGSRFAMMRQSIHRGGVGFFE